MNLKEIVGINLKYYRYKTGMSQEKFYTSLELNPKYLANIERGEENISIDYIYDLAKKLNVDINDLILFNEDHVIKKKRIDEKEKVNS
jgi:transcriptional regulator with XRE-family HTH domain